jgi:hypothetical protein
MGTYRPNGRKNLLASEPRYRPGKKSGNDAQNDSYHGFLLSISLKSVWVLHPKLTHLTGHVLRWQHYFSFVFQAALKLIDIRYRRSELPGTRISQPWVIEDFILLFLLLALLAQDPAQGVDVAWLGSLISTPPMALRDTTWRAPFLEFLEEVLYYLSGTSIAAHKIGFQPARDLSERVKFEFGALDEACGAPDSNLAHPTRLPALQI